VDDTGDLLQIDDPDGVSQAVVEAMPKGSIWWQEAGQVFLKIPPRASPCTFRVTVVRMSKERQARGATLVPEVTAPADLAALTKGGPARWPETGTTTGEVAFAAGQSAISNQQSEIPAYVVDNIRLPDPNPWGAPMFTGGFDFFPRPLEGAAPSVPGGGSDGALPSRPSAAAAICTFHGDVFVVSGLDAKLEQVTWRRFASGLYHALGLKIVNGEIYVTCRDGLWRLKDLNGDGECDSLRGVQPRREGDAELPRVCLRPADGPGGQFLFHQGRAGEERRARV
jgi:hypothetical protein